ncbi:hypothetical protein DH2020_000114 [Rehmannia glutinosa]|uniref:Uncharacterized protein n=1 Tax=Rehmannia glutinosa TaxID=99300 RepID=A0ABR0XW70_REHGL
MKFLQILRKAVTSPENRHRVASISANSHPFSHQIHSQPSHPASFGIAFDIDGVILRGDTPIGGSPQALRRLYDDSGTLRIPYVFLTNGGGVPESKRATELSKLLSVHIVPSQVIQGHSPFKQLLKRFENELIIAVGKGEPALVMSEYGFKNVLTIDEYASYFEHIDPLGRFKNWVNQQAGYDKSFSGELDRRNDPCSQRVQAVFIVSDSVDWSRDIQWTSDRYYSSVNRYNIKLWKLNCALTFSVFIHEAPKSEVDRSKFQVLCDILSTGGLPGKEISSQPPLYFANDDLLYQGLFPTERLGMGAFRIALESIYNRIYPNVLEYTSYGKPNPCVFRNAENVLMQVVPSTISPQINGQSPFKTLYMIGDNPSVDIRGAQQVVDTVEEAVDYILRKEAF